MARRLLNLTRTLSQHSSKLTFLSPRQPPNLDYFVKKDLVLEPLGLHRLLSTSGIIRSDSEPESSDSDNEASNQDDFLKRYLNPKDRSRYIPPELSIKYMESVAYKTAYGDEPVWRHYRRNFKPVHKGRPPVKTRETCIRQGMVATGSPCPICRDEYLVIDYRNVALLNQFLENYTGKILSPAKTNICQKQWRKLRIALEKAQDHGYLDLDVPALHYDLEEYKPARESQ